MTKAERDHMDRIHHKPCLVCGKWPVEAHHVTGYADRKGRVSRRHDRVVPLCAEHHNSGRESVHSLSHRGFFERHGIDLMAEAERLWEQ